MFWSHHNPANINGYKGRQHRSIVLYSDEVEQDIILKVMKNRERQGEGRPDTEISPLTVFYPAEDRHQKYHLKRYPDAVEKLSRLYPSHEELVNPTLAARMNGLAKRYANLAQIVREIRTWPISGEEQDEIIRLIRQIKW